MRLTLVGVAAGAVLAGVSPLANVSGAATPKSPAWITVRGLALPYKYGALPTRARQTALGRVRLDRIARVSSVVIHGKKVTGDLLLIQGKYQNLAAQRSYWTEGYAFVLGTNPTACTLDTCGPLPTGNWSLMTHAFGTPVVDYPAKGTVPANGTVSFREAIPLPPGSLAGGSAAPATTTTTTPTPGEAKPGKPVVIHSLHDIWLLPIYGAFQYYEAPFPPSQLVRLSTYFGRTAISG